MEILGTVRPTPEVGLLWAIDPRRQQRGYAAEAGAALIDCALVRLHLWRVLATTEYHNLASQTVMRKLGMTLTRNPLPDPPWLQIVGVLTDHRFQITAPAKATTPAEQLSRTW